MSFSRWKLMAGVLGVSIGGLAAAASQCPKLDMSKGRSSEPPVAKADPKLPPAGAPSAPALPDVPPVPSIVPTGATPPAPALPTPHVILPQADTTKVPAPTTTLPSLPDLPPARDKHEKAPKHSETHFDVIPTSAGPLPGTPSTPASAKASDSKSGTPLPPPVAAPVGDLMPPTAATTPNKVPHAPKSDPLPSLADPLVAPPEVTGTALQKPTIAPAVGQPLPPPAATHHEEKLPSNVPGPNALGGFASPDPTTSGSGKLPPLPSDSAPVQAPADVPASKPTFVQPASVPMAAVAEAKFRIILRVGEGEPTFEVKNGDNLVLKVACEKVDIESVEKGTGLSKVTARGKVRFAGFGAEGTCESLSFLAGTGEVQMNGEVKVQVKDKLGRVESELTTATMKYKIDASAVGGTLKP